MSKLQKSEVYNKGANLNLRLVELFPKGTEELKEIIEKEIGQVHSIRINRVYNSVFAAKMYSKLIVRSSIDNLEKNYGYRLIRIDLLTAELTFKKLDKNDNSNSNEFTNSKGLKVQLHPENKNVIATVEVPTIRGPEYTKHVQVVKRKIDNTFFYVSHERKGAEGVFPTYAHMQANYAALRQITEAEFLERIQ